MSVSENPGWPGWLARTARLARAALAGFLLCLGAAQAQPAGHDAPTFQLAVDAWLSGEDDRAALQAFSILARDGNVAAQVLLSRLADQRGGQRHATRGMTRRERIALFRAPRGPNGTSWLKVAAESDPLAAALWQAQDPETRLAALPRLIAQGEADTALGMVFHAAAQDPLLDPVFLRDAAEILRAQASDLPPDAAYVALRAAEVVADARLPGAPGAGAVAAAQAGVPLAMRWNWLAPDNVAMIRDGAFYADVASLAPDVRLWTPYRLLCREACPDSANACTAAFGRMVYIGQPRFLTSPVQSLVSNDRYWSSPRIKADMARATSNANTWFDNFTARAPCAHRTMISLQDAYGAAR